MENKRIYRIYKHTAPNGKAYIGMTVQSLSRRACGRYKGNEEFYLDIQKFGWDNFKHEVLLTVGTKEMAMKAEEAMIVGFNTLKPNGYNDSLGHKASEQCLEKRKVSLKGRKAWNKGISSSEETKRKIRESHKGKSTWNKGLVGVTTFGRKCFTNGTINVLRFECPEGYWLGRTKH